jgi:hypothetical protein
VPPHDQAGENFDSQRSVLMVRQSHALVRRHPPSSCA